MLDKIKSGVAALTKEEQQDMLAWRAKYEEEQQQLLLERLEKQLSEHLGKRAAIDETITLTEPDFLCGVGRCRVHFRRSCE